MINPQFFKISDTLVINKNCITHIIETTDDSDNKGFETCCQIYVIGKTDAITYKVTLEMLLKEL